VDIPGWETPESVTAWVRALRQESDEGMLWDWERARTETLPPKQEAIDAARAARPTPGDKSPG
jgi:hypothetical protein